MSCTEHHSSRFVRWLMTQNHQPVTGVSADGWLVQDRDLWSRRAPGNTCVIALKASQRLGFLAENNSKDCGAVMRAAPCAFFGNAFEYAAASRPDASLTGIQRATWPQACLPTSFSVWQTGKTGLNMRWRKAWQSAVTNLAWKSCASSWSALSFFFYEGYRATPESIYEFGGGWIAEQALAIGVWCALTATSFEQAVIGAVNHSGDSGSIGLITGHLLGGRYGAAAIPARWYEGQELRSGTEKIAHGIDRMQREYSGCGGAADGEI